MGRRRAMLKHKIKRKLQSFVHLLQTKKVAMVWVIVSVFVWYITDFFHVLFDHPLVNQEIRTISIIGFTSITIITIFVCFGLPSLYNIHNVEQYNPNLIKVGAALSGISFSSVIIALWPIWGMYTMLILFILRKGFYGLSDLLPRKKYNQFSGILFIFFNMFTIMSHRLKGTGEIKMQV